MSNPKTTAGAIQFLSQNPEKNFLTLTNTDNNTRIGKDEVYYNDIPGADLQSYIRLNIGQTATSTKVWIEFRTKYGASSKKEGTAFLVEVQATAPIQVQAPVPAYHSNPVPEYPAASFLGSPNMGLGVAQIIDLHGKANRLQDKEEQLAEMKGNYADLKAKYDALDVEKRGLDTKLSIAEAQKDMAVMLAKAENKSIFDSPAFQALMEKAPSLFMAYKGMVPPEMAASGLGMPSMSQTKQDLVDHIAENLTDEQANFLGSVAHFLDNPEFLDEVKNLIKKYYESGN
ncbi:hypothetical protein [Flavobacterium lindanitolerans]|uniref:hypothetical protein n=1 Tax=Flavobacterium lindanitolerans TaxID=428988 RepID=UPI0023F3B0F7|nr:hypothetical protein [Flavobacterium lindanitolerans]